MSTQEQIAEVERRAKVLSLPMAFILHRAEVPASTWTRWKKGTYGPTKKKWDAVIAALEDIERRLA